MKVDFNNLRLQTASNYTRVVDILNNHPSVVAGEAVPFSYVDVVSLRQALQDLRINILGLCCCYQADDPDCISLENEDVVTHMPRLNY